MDSDTKFGKELTSPPEESCDLTDETKNPPLKSERPKTQTRLYPDLPEEQGKDAKIQFQDSKSVTVAGPQEETTVPSESDYGAKPLDQRSPNCERTPNENPSASQLNTSDMSPGVVSGSPKYKIFVIGKTGTGKSSLCNKIVGSMVFETGQSFESVTTATREESVHRLGWYITVVDTPDISNKEESSQKRIVEEWKTSARGHNYMVVLAVRCDQRYSPAEYDVYRQIRHWWGHDLCRRLVVAFTFADTRKDPSVDMEEKLKKSGLSFN